MTTIAEIQQTAEHKMNRTVETLREEFTKLRTGRASVGLLDHISVEYYGSMTPLSQVANLGVGDARTLTVQPWDRKMIPVIEKAILMSDLGLNPATSGDIIRVPLPPLTEERRREITKVVRSEGEDAKVALLSVTEGDDKPEKYPLLFNLAKAMVLNKVDLLPYVDFDRERARDFATRLNKELAVFEVSCRDGSGLEGWYQWLRDMRAGKL